MRFVLVLAAPFLIAAAGDMRLSTFLQRADKLERRGPAALFSNELKLLSAEIVGARDALYREQEAARRAGRRPATCMPAKVRNSSTEVLRHFRAIPPAQRQGMSVKAAYTRLVQAKYPCR